MDTCNGDTILFTLSSSEPPAHLYCISLFLISFSYHSLIKALNAPAYNAKIICSCLAYSLLLRKCCWPNVLSSLCLTLFSSRSLNLFENICTSMGDLFLDSQMTSATFVAAAIVGVAFSCFFFSFLLMLLLLLLLLLCPALLS